MAHGPIQAPIIRRAAGILAVIVVLLELFFAAQPLAFNRPTAPQAFSSLRTAPAHILAAQRAETAPGRFLSMSDMGYDPGDRAETELMFRGPLSPQQIYDYIICIKRQEILAPTCPCLAHLCRGRLRRRPATAGPLRVPAAPLSGGRRDPA